MILETSRQEISSPHHNLIFGKLGSCKTTLLCSFLPGEEMARRNCALNKLPHYGVYYLVGKKQPKNFEPTRKMDENGVLTMHWRHLSETALVGDVLVCLLKSLKQNIDFSSLTPAKNDILYEHMRLFIRNTLAANPKPRPHVPSVVSLLDRAIERLEFEQPLIKGALESFSKQKGVAYKPNYYLGWGNGFIDVQRPFVEQKIIPAPIFLLIDDGNKLNKTQAQIVNDLISKPVDKSHVCVKLASAPEGYKTLITSNGTPLQRPQDLRVILLPAKAQPL